MSTAIKERPVEITDVKELQRRISDLEEQVDALAEENAALLKQLHHAKQKKRGDATRGVLTPDVARAASRAALVS